LFPIKLAKQAQHCLPPAGGLRRFDVIEVPARFIRHFASVVVPTFCIIALIPIRRFHG